MIVRLLILVALIGSAYLTVAFGERRTRPMHAGLNAGITIVTGPQCRLCDPAVAALQSRGATPQVLDVSDIPASLGPIRGLPVAILTDHDGQVIMRRSGRSIITDAAQLAGAAAAL